MDIHTSTPQSLVVVPANLRFIAQITEYEQENIPSPQRIPSDGNDDEG